MDATYRRVPVIICQQLLTAAVFATLAGCSSVTTKDRELILFEDRWYVASARYSNHMTAMELEGLHRIQIEDIAGLRKNLENVIALDVQILWTSTQDEHTTAQDRDQAYGLLRLIAIQNEKFPVRALTDDFTLMLILQDAIQKDRSHAELLRRQDWTKPKWVNWVN